MRRNITGAAVVVAAPGTGSYGGGLRYSAIA
jgi:hypothetical protein